MPNQLTIPLILLLIAFGFFFEFGRAAFDRLWALCGERAQLVIAIVVLVVVLVWALAGPAGLKL